MVINKKFILGVLMVSGVTENTFTRVSTGFTAGSPRQAITGEAQPVEALFAVRQQLPLSANEAADSLGSVVARMGWRPKPVRR
jgi:hypothetical protein